MTCCRCSNRGVCRSCSCVKDGKSCTSCLPLSLGLCLNAVSDRPAEIENNDDHSDDVIQEERVSDTQTTSPRHTQVNLPAYEPACPPNFVWGDKGGEEVVNDIDKIYSKTVHWRHNLYKIPSGKFGKQFVKEVARLFNTYAEASPMEGITLKAVMALPALVLQKPFRESRSKDHSKCLERRLKHWEAGQFMDLFNEAESIQARLVRTSSILSQNSKPISRKFAELMMVGKVKTAVRMLTRDNQSVGTLPLNKDIDGKSVRDILREKHPPAQALNPEAVFPPASPSTIPHSVIFDEIDGISILKSALHTEGSAGPSGLDAYLWRRMCCSFQNASSALSEALACTARRISSTFVDPCTLATPDRL